MIELTNLAENLDAKELKEIATRVIEEAKVDDESRRDWLDMHAEWVKLFYQKDKPVNRPWNGASEEAVPILAEACVQFGSRAYSAMFPNQNIIRCVPVGRSGEVEKQRAKRVGRHMSWQLMVQNKNYKRDKDRLLHSVGLHGSCFTKAYYHPLLARNVVENVRAEDLILPYGSGPRNMEDIERKTHEIPISVNNTRILAAGGFFLKEAKPYSKWGDRKPTQEAQDDAQGQTPPSRDLEDLALVYEQHRNLDLDGDGIEEPYIVWVDVEAEDVLRIAIRYEVDQNGAPTDYKRPIEYFTHYAFIENPDGVYGLGMGHLVGPPNTAVNKLLRQTIDAATLANVGNHSGFVSKALAMKKGILQMVLGKFVPTESNAEDLQKGIFQFKFPGPSNVLPAMMEMLLGRSDRLAFVTEAVTGQTDKVMQPTTVLALIEQSQKVYASVYERLLNAWGSELEKIYYLNSKHLNEEEYFSVQDVDGSIIEGQVGRKDYAPDLQVQPVADPKLVHEQQRLKKAEAEWMFLSQNPLVMQSPMHFYNASRRFLEALGSTGIDAVLPNPAAQMPMRADDPMIENMGALQPLPIVPPAYIDQDHIMHLQAHDAFLMDPVYGARLAPEGVRAMQMHRQMHIAMMYGATESSALAMTGPEDGQPARPDTQEAPPALPAAGGMGLGGVMGPDQPPQGAAGRA